MKALKKNTSLNSKGNALFLILIAVALFAALSYALTQSGRGGGSTDKETETLDAARLVQYAGAVERGIQRMRILNGTQDTDISFHDNGWGFTGYQHGSPQPDENRVFQTDGGGVTWQDFSDVGILKYNGVNSVNGVGACDDNSSSACKDLMMVVILSSESMCQQINKSLFGNTAYVSEDFTTGTTSPSNTIFNGTYGTSTADSTALIDASLNGVRTACVQDSGTATKFIFYHVLLAR